MSWARVHQGLQQQAAFGHQPLAGLKAFKDRDLAVAFRADFDRVTLKLAGAGFEEEIILVLAEKDRFRGHLQAHGYRIRDLHRYIEFGLQQLRRILHGAAGPDRARGGVKRVANQIQAPVESLPGKGLGADRELHPFMHQGQVHLRHVQPDPKPGGVGHHESGAVNCGTLASIWSGRTSWPGVTFRSTRMPSNGLGSRKLWLVEAAVEP